MSLFLLWASNIKTIHNISRCTRICIINHTRIRSRARAGSVIVWSLRVVRRSLIVSGFMSMCRSLLRTGIIEIRSFDRYCARRRRRRRLSLSLAGVLCFVHLYKYIYTWKVWFVCVCFCIYMCLADQDDKRFNGKTSNNALIETLFIISIDEEKDCLQIHSVHTK